MFNKFKEYFKNRPPFQKKIASSSLLSQSEEILLDDLLLLISCFENNHSEFITKTPTYYIQQYFQLALETEFSQYYVIRNKILLTCHLMLHEFQLGIEFADYFLSQKFTTFLQPTGKDQKEDWLTSNIQTSYFQYLQKLAVNIQVFHACKVQQYPLFQEGSKFVDIQTKLLWLFKISNLVNNGLGQTELLKQALQLVPQDLLLKEIVLVYWSDIIVFYNFLSKEVIISQISKKILQLLDYYRHLASNICLQFYELYIQLFQIRNSISELYKFRKHFDRDNVIKQPKWFDVNKPVHKQVEEYMLQQKISQGSHTDRMNRPQLSKRSAKSNMDTKIDASNIPRPPIGIKTHRAGRGGDSDGDDEDFENLKLILQQQNLQQKLADHKNQKQDTQMSFQQKSSQEGTDLPKN